MAERVTTHLVVASVLARIRRAHRLHHLRMVQSALATVVALSMLSACSGAIGMGDDDGTDASMPAANVEITGPDVLPHVQRFANEMCAATGACTIGTRVGHHPSAERAIDILVSDAFGEVPSDNNVLGDKVAQFTLDHQAEHGVWYLIWRQRYNDGSGWDPMEDRGSITQNHYDHVHVSFDATAP